MNEIVIERVKQLSKYPTEHDDKLGVAHLVDETGRRVYHGMHEPATREQLIQGAAMLIAAIEVIDRAKS